MSSPRISKKSGKEVAHQSLLRDTRGATAVEYALMLVAVLLIVAGAFKTLGQKVSEKANRAATELQ